MAFYREIAWFLIFLNKTCFCPVGLYSPHINIRVFCWAWHLWCAVFDLFSDLFVFTISNKHWDGMHNLLRPALQWIIKECLSVWRFIIWMITLAPLKMLKCLLFKIDYSERHERCWGSLMGIIIDLSFGRMVTDSPGIRSLHTTELPTRFPQSQGEFLHW